MTTFTIQQKAKEENHKYKTQDEKPSNLEKKTREENQNFKQDNQVKNRLTWKKIEIEKLIKEKTRIYIRYPLKISLKLFLELTGNF